MFEEKDLIMKRILSLLLVLALAVGVMTVSTFAAEIGTLANKCSLALKVGEGDVYPGGTVEITVAVAENPGIAGLKFALDYNADVFALREVKTEDYPDGSELLVDGFLEIGPNGTVWANSENLEENTDIITLIFDVGASAEAGEYTIGFAADSVSGGHAAETDELYVEFNLGDAVTVTITEATYKPGDVNMDNGVNVSDLQDMLLHINGEVLLTGTGFMLGDLDNNSAINVSDLQSLLLHLNGEELLY